jgi:hypothetical protein
LFGGTSISLRRAGRSPEKASAVDLIREALTVYVYAFEHGPNDPGSIEIDLTTFLHTLPPYLREVEISRNNREVWACLNAAGEE